MKIEEAVKKYPHIIQLGEDGVPELFADHHMLSHLRLCEAYFVENFLNNLHQKGLRSWSLEFGIWFHKVMEKFYQSYSQQSDETKDIYLLSENNKFEIFRCSDLVDYASKVWLANDMQYFVLQPNYYKVCAKIGGLTGGISLVTAYWCMYGAGRDTFKIIGTELSFGKGKEVPILEQPLPQYGIPFRAFYSGRIDAVNDDDTSVSPVDHKTTSKIGPDTGRDFNPHEGMEGYVFALAKIYKRFFPDIQRNVDKAYVNHVQVSYDANFVNRFKRTPLYYSPAKLEQWRLRQIRSFKKMWQLLVDEETPDWNTQTCHNIYNYPCPFRTLHEQDPVNRQAYLNAHYVTIDPWDASKVEGVREGAFNKEVK